jgi:hypothetical protein
MFIVLSVSTVIHVISGEHRNNFRTDCRFKNMYMLFRACFQVVFRLFSGYFGVCFGLVLGVVFLGGSSLWEETRALGENPRLSAER